jgi:hypothetical protein
MEQMEVDDDEVDLPPAAPAPGAPLPESPTLAPSLLPHTFKSSVCIEQPGEFPDDMPPLFANGRPIQWVRGRNHPMRARGDLADKWYNLCDRVTPTIDAMERMHRSLRSVEKHGCFGIFSQPSDAELARERARKEEKRLRQEAAAINAKAGSAAWRCPICGETDRTTLSETRDGMTCACGYTTTRFVSGHRQKACAEEDDKTQTADRPTDARSATSFDPTRRVQPTADERRAARIADVRGTRVGGGRRRNALATAQATTDREAAAAAQAHAIEMGALTARQQVKLGRILDAVGDMLQQLAPIDESVAVRIRTAAYDAYHAAVRHEMACGDGCPLQFAARSPMTIAGAVFETELQSMLRSDTPPANKQRLLELSDRMARSTAFAAAASATQRSSARATIELMRSTDWVRDAPCCTAPPRTDAANAPSPVCAPAFVCTPLTRADSLSSEYALNNSTSTGSLDSAASPSQARGAAAPVEVRFRDAVTQVFALFRAELPVVVRDGALRMLANKNVCDALRTDARLQALSLQATAFALLTAVHKAQRLGANECDLTVPRTNVGIAARLGMGVATAEDAVDALLPLVPDEVASESEHEEDDLFS